MKPSEVTASVDELFRLFDVVRFYGDPAQGWDEQLAEWAGKHGPKKVLFFYTDSRNMRRIAESCGQYASAIRSGEVLNDGDHEFMSHISSAQKREIKMVDDEGKPLWTITKERHDSLNKIDLAMCGVLSWRARLDALAAGEGQKRDSRVLVFR